MNKLCCFLSGGHRYLDANLISCRNEIKRTIVLKNYCVKCGEPTYFEMSEKIIDKHIKEYKLRLWRRLSKSDNIRKSH